jgi:hypothetical protein
MFLNYLEALGFNCLLLSDINIITIQKRPYNFDPERILLRNMKTKNGNASNPLYQR